LLIDVHNGAYGQYRQEVIDPTASLHQFVPQAILFSLTVREAIAGVPLTASIVEADEVVTRFIGELRSLWRKAREIHNAAIIQQTSRPD
jgi:predicted enzyme involved in methoxymalonyl-ACP biosynthesis